MPELLVSLSGSFQQLGGVDASGLIVGNATGSAIAQGTLVLGVAGLTGYLSVAPRMIRRDGATLVLAIVLVTLLAFDGTVGRVEGGALAIAYLMYLVALYQAERGRGEPSQPTTGAIPPWLLVFGGLVTVGLAAHVVIVQGVELAERWGITQTVLGALIIGAGTSLPELALSIGAARQGHSSMSVGNVIGSNVFDLLIPVGVGALIVPLSVAPATLSVDLPAIAIATVALLVFLVRKRGLQRREAVVLLSGYVVYALIRVRVGML